MYKRPTRVIYINMKIQKPKNPHLQTFPKFENMNYGTYTKYKIQPLFFVLFVFLEIVYFPKFRK